MAGLEAVLAGEVSASHEPVTPASEFREDIERIYLALKSRHPQRLAVQVLWIAVDVEGCAPNHPFGDEHVALAPDERGAAAIRAPRGGFAPGAYRADLVVDGVLGRSLPFRIVPLHPSAVPVENASLPASFNLAARVLGGKVESWTSQYSKDWQAAYLIDGEPSSWSSSDNTVPQDIVFSFYQGREAQISAVVIDTRTAETARRLLLPACQRSPTPTHGSLLNSRRSGNSNSSSPPETACRGVGRCRTLRAT